MNKIMKKRKLSIKWNVFFCLLLFTAVIILILWLCQVAFLDDIYKAVKMGEIRDSAAKITKALNTDDPGSVVDEIGENSTCVTVMDISSKVTFVPLYTHHSISSCVIHSIDMESIFTLYNHATKNDGVSIQRFMYDSGRRKYIGIEGELFDKSLLGEYNKDLPESIIYSSLATDDKGRELFILLNTEISPVNATVGTLNKILKVVSIILVGFSLLLATLISLMVTRPIVKLTEEARKLGREDYSAKFDQESYREVAQLSSALEHAKQELQRVDTLRRELIANISHDLRTPLTMIGGYSEMMRDIPGENNAENAQIIIDETNRLSSLVNDVLDISKLQSGVGEFEFKCFNITETVRDILKRLTRLCEKDGYTIDFFCDGDAYVISDEKRITQVIYNLIINAMTHTGEDKRIAVRQLVSDSAVRIEVEDSGEGIAPENLPLIWDRYYKVDKVHKRSAHGSGLGLSIIKTIIDRAGGRYGVSSAVGVGSTFFIELERAELNAECGIIGDKL